MSCLINFAFIRTSKIMSAPAMSWGERARAAQAAQAARFPNGWARQTPQPAPNNRPAPTAAPIRRPTGNVQSGTSRRVACALAAHSTPQPHITDSVVCLFALTLSLQAARFASKFRVVPAYCLE